MLGCKSRVDDCFINFIGTCTLLGLGGGWLVCCRVFRFGEECEEYRWCVLKYVGMGMLVVGEPFRIAQCLCATFVTKDQLLVALVSSTHGIRTNQTTSRYLRCLFIQVEANPQVNSGLSQITKQIGPERLANFWFTRRTGKCCTSLL